ncbi:MAG: glycosyltransferase family 39 protein [Alphaproteobacteria bacterium]|nr:glycosyltransferase family 39 protein [Alphaproteobacteria bacterium]
MSRNASKPVYLAVVAALAMLCLLGLVKAAAAIGLHVPLDPNEGWNAYHAAAAMGAGPLYPAAGSYLVNNYPPLSFYLVGALARLVGDAIVAGRLVSLASFVFLLIALFAAARRMGANLAAALFAPLLFAGILLVFSDYVAMDDPQMLAQALAMGGFLILLREPRRAPAVLAAALLFVLAAFVKHNVVAQAVASTAWVALFDRRNALRLAAAGIGFLVIGLGLFHAVYGTGLLAHLITPRGYSLEDLRLLLSGWLEGCAVPLAGLAGLVVLGRRDRHVQFCALYAGLGLAIGVVFLGGAGVDINVLFDADLALSLGAALLLGKFAEGWRAPAAAAAMALPLLVPVVANAEAHEAWLHPLNQDSEMASADVAFLARHKGPAICEMLSLCYWAAKPAAVDVFNTGQAFDTGARSDRELVSRIVAQRYAVIQFDPDSPEPLGDNVRDAMQRAYRLDHEDDLGSFYVPR